VSGPVELASSDVVTVAQHASVYEVARRMQRESVGCVVVLDDDGLPLGVITDRDLALRVVAAERPAGATLARDVMSRPLVAVQAADPIERVVACLTENGIRRVPVLHEGRVVGLVGLDDLLSHLGRSLDALCAVTISVTPGRGEARRAAAVEQLRSEVESRLHGLREQVDQMGASARDSVLREFDALRDRVRRILQ
jgi:signal-transduction protein with cAMP-binding, CBS, and nucleotidyltransferase domain